MFVNSFNEYYGKINSWAAGFFEHEIGVAIHTENMYPEKDLIKTEFYSDWLQPQEDIRTGGGVILQKDKDRMFALGANIRKKDSEKLNALWLKLLTELTPHLQHSFEISRSFSGVTLENLALANNVSGMGTAVLAVTLSQKLLYANSSAMKMLESGHLLKQTIGGVINFSDESSEKILNDIRLRHCLLDRPCSSNFIIRESHDYVCHITTQSPNLLFTSPLEIVVKDRSSFILISLSVVAGEPEILNSLQRKFGLTKRESQVVVEVSNGKSIQNIAISEIKSIHTIRNQLKRAMAKLGVARQAELVVFIQNMKK